MLSKWLDAMFLSSQYGPCAYAEQWTVIDRCFPEWRNAKPSRSLWFLLLAFGKAIDEGRDVPADTQ